MPGPMDFHLAREGRELVIRQGLTPTVRAYHNRHVLVIGGGVTGLTVSEPLSEPSIALTVK